MKVSVTRTARGLPWLSFEDRASYKNSKTDQYDAGGWVGDGCCPAAWERVPRLCTPSGPRMDGRKGWGGPLGGQRCLPPSHTCGAHLHRLLSCTASCTVPQRP